MIGGIEEEIYSIDGRQFIDMMHICTQHFESFDERR